MSEHNDYLTWKKNILEKPFELINRHEIYEKFNMYCQSILVSGFLPDSIIQFTDEFLNTVIVFIANKLVCMDINEINKKELELINLYIQTFFDLGIYGALSQDKSALSSLLLIIGNINKPLFEKGRKKQLYSFFLNQLYLKGAIESFSLLIRASQNIELLSIALKLTSLVSPYDPFFQNQVFFDISFQAILRIFRLKKDIILDKFLISSFDSIQEFLPCSDESNILFIQSALPFLATFIKSENLEQRSNAISQLLKYAKDELLQKEVVDFFSSHNRFSLFRSVELHYSLSQKIGELMSIIISNSSKIGKPGIITEIWNQHENAQSKYDLLTFYDTFIYVGTYLKSNLFDEFIVCILNAKISIEWFKMIEKLSVLLSKRVRMKETFKKIRKILWKLLDLYTEDNLLLQYTKNSLIRMIGFNADETDLDKIKNFQETDSSFFYLLLNSYLEKGNEINEESINEFLDTILNDLSANNHSPMMINDIKQLCSLLSSLTTTQLNLLINSIEYFPDFFQFMSSLLVAEIIMPTNILYISHKIQPNFINDNFYYFIKLFINNNNPLDKCIVKLPINFENLIWEYSIIDSPVRTKFAKLLSRIYQMNDGKQLTDSEIIDIFLQNWYQYYLQNKNNKISLNNLLNLLWIFIDIYESNMYRDTKRFGFPLSIERTINAFTLDIKCEKPEFSLILSYPSNYTIESAIEEIQEKYKLISLNNTNVYVSGDPVKRSALIKDLAKGDISFQVDLKIEKDIIIPHKYHIRNEIPSTSIIKKKWNIAFLEPLICEGNENAFEIIKLLPSISKDLNIESKLSSAENPAEVFEELLNIKFPYLFAYHFLLIYFNTVNDSRLLAKLFEYKIVDYLGKIIINLNPNKIYCEICYIFNLFIVNILKLHKFNQDLRNNLIMTLLALAEKGFNLNIIKKTFDILLSYNKKELKFASFPYIRLLFDQNLPVQMFALDIFNSIDIEFSEFLDILRNHKEQINGNFILSLANHITSNIDQDIIDEIFDVIMNLQKINKNGYLLKSAFTILHQFLKFGFLNYEKRQLILQLIIDRILSINFSDEDLIAFESATPCLIELSNTETYSLHKVFDNLHSDRKPFEKFYIDGKKCSKSKAGIVGLKRIENTCYFNSIMQMLFAIKPIRNIIMSYDGEDNFLIELSKLFVLLKKTNARYINTKSILKYLTYSDGSKVDISIQQDAAEFLQIILNKIKDAEKLFLGEIVDVYEGMNEDFRMKNEELFINFDLDVQNISTLEESFDIFMRPIEFTGSNKFLNEKTKEKIDVKKYTKIKKAPQFLIIHLKRFESINFEYIGEKIDDYFKVPFEFDISPYSLEKFSIYQLTGVIVHTGTAMSGHYNCLSLTKHGWVKIDDIASSFINEKDLIKLIQGGTNQGSAYILFYTMKTGIKYPKCEINPKLLKYAEEMNYNNNEKRLFCSTNYFNIMKNLNSSIQFDFHDIVLKYAIDSLPFTYINEREKLIVDDFYSNLIQKSKSKEFMLVEKFRFLDYSIKFLKEDLLLCPYTFIRKHIADLILTNLNHKANPYQFLIIVFDLVKESLNYPNQFGQVFYLIFSILKEYKELKESNNIQSILYNLLEKDLLPFINGASDFSNVDMTYILEILIMYNSLQHLKNKNMLSQLFVSETSIDSIVHFIKLVFKNNTKEINEFLDQNVSQFCAQKFISFYFFYNPNEAIQIAFEKLDSNNLKITGMRLADDYDVAYIFADLLSKCQWLSNYFAEHEVIPIWVPRFLLNFSSLEIRKMALCIFSYIIPHENFAKWRLSSKNKFILDLKFASIRENPQDLNIDINKTCSIFINYLTDEQTINLIENIFHIGMKNESSIFNDDFCIQYFQLIHELLLASTESFELNAFNKLYEIIIKNSKNPITESFICLLKIIFNFKVLIPQKLFETGLKEIKSFSQFGENSFNEFLNYFLQIYKNYRTPSNSFLNRFLKFYVFSPEMNSKNISAILDYSKLILPKNKTKSKSEKNVKLAKEILAIIDNNYKIFASNNFSSLLFLLNRIQNVLVSNNEERINRSVSDYLQSALEKQQFLNINKIIKFTLNICNDELDQDLIQLIIENYRSDINDDIMKLLEEIFNNQYYSSYDLFSDS